LEVELTSSAAGRLFPSY